ncbi:MAG TPA: crossover junction endodeoxyribonuclease RuvC [Egibacteraceae bacterium]|nr:crossover junction endodeoxyribonuclease RuvC [Egibacteraceae bacterium]
MEVVRVLGVDPGLSRCGVGVVDGPAGNPTAVRVGVIRTPADAPTAERLAALHAEIVGLVAATRPDAVAVERVFFNANVRTAMGVGQAAGVVLLAAAQAGVAVREYTPTQVKAAVAGHGAADKAQVGYMVRALLHLADAPKPPDAADALALALCHLQRAGAPGGEGQGMSPRLAAAVEAAGPGAQVTPPRR